MIQKRFFLSAIALFILSNLSGLIDPNASFARGTEPSVGPEESPEQSTPDASDSKPDIVPDDAEVSDAEGDQSGQAEEPQPAPAPTSEQADGLVDDAGDQAVTQEEAAPPPPTADSTPVEYQPPPVTIEPEPIPTSMRRRIWGLQLGLGMGFGGDDLVTAYYTDGSDETLYAGTGIGGTIGTTVTPFYFDGHAIGFGLDFGIKGWNIGGSDTNFQLNMTRLPLMLSGIYTFSVSNSVDLLAAGGLQLEFYPNMSGSGAMDDIDVEFDTAVGGFLEAGVMFGNPYFAVDITLRYTLMTYTSDEIIEEINGNNFGFNLRLHIGLLTTPKS